MKSLGASLAARVAESSRENIARRKKKDPKNRTLTCAATTAMYNAVGKLAVRLDVSRTRAIEMALEELCAKHGIEIGEADE